MSEAIEPPPARLALGWSADSETHEPRGLYVDAAWQLPPERPVYILVPQRPGSTAFRRLHKKRTRYREVVLT